MFFIMPVFIKLFSGGFSCLSLTVLCFCRWWGKTFWLLFLILGNFHFSHFVTKCTGTYFPALSITIFYWKKAWAVLNDFECQVLEKLIFLLTWTLFLILIYWWIGFSHWHIYNFLLLATQGIRLEGCWLLILRKLPSCKKIDITSDILYLHQ